MGFSWIDHSGPGVLFVAVGLWQLYNHIKLHSQHPKLYSAPTWFPFPRVRHMELYLIIFASCTSIAIELFVVHTHHHHFDPADGSIPTIDLQNFEHATISLSFLVYALFALHFDRVRPLAANELSFLLPAAAFGMEFLILYLHSTDHAGVEWQYHWLLLTTVSVSLATTLLGICHPQSFVLGFTRSVSVVFQGVWLILLRVMLYTPRFIPKGCSLQSDEGRLVVPCESPAAVHRAKALVNLQFAWSLLAVHAFCFWFYLHQAKKYREVPEYESLGQELSDSSKEERGEGESGRSQVNMKGFEAAL